MSAPGGTTRATAHPLRRLITETDQELSWVNAELNWAKRSKSAHIGACKVVRKALYRSLDELRTGLQNLHDAVHVAEPKETR